MSIPEQYKEICPICGGAIDARDLGQVMAHGNFNMITGKYECIASKQIKGYSSRKIGEAVEWKDGKEQVNLN